MPRKRTKDANNYLKTYYDQNEARYKVDKGGLNDEVLSTGNLEVLKEFLSNNATKLTKEELEYLNIRIRAQEAFEREKGKQLGKLTAGEDKQLPEVKDERGYITLPGIKLDRGQSSTNGCWSCATSLLLKSRGVDLTQEEIRAWKPNYQPNGGKTFASKQSLYERNADTGCSIEDNADLITEVSPNTALSSMYIAPMDKGAIALKGEDAKIIPATPQEQEMIHNEFLNQAEKTLKEKIMTSIIDHKSPVAINVDGHTVTITGINTDGRLLVQDSRRNPLECELHVRNFIHWGLETHQVRTHEGTVVTRPPRGLNITWLHDVPVKAKEKDGTIVEADLGILAQKIKVDGAGEVKIDEEKQTEDFIEVSKVAEGVVSSKGVEFHNMLDPTEITKKFGGKMPVSYSSPIPLYLTTTLLPNKVRIKGNFADREAFVTAKKENAEQVNDIINTTSEPEFSKLTKKLEDSPKFDQADGKLNEIMDILIEGTKKKNEFGIAKMNKIKELPNLLTAKMENGRTYLQELNDALSYTKKVKLFNNLYEIDTFYGLGTDFGAAMGVPFDVYPADAEHFYTQENHCEKINQHLADDDKADKWYGTELERLVTEEMLWQSGFGQTHISTKGKKAADLPEERQKKNAAVFADIEKKGGFKEFVKDAKSPQEIFGRFMKRSIALGLDKGSEFRFSSNEMKRGGAAVRPAATEPVKKTQPVQTQTVEPVQTPQPVEPQIVEPVQTPQPVRQQPKKVYNVKLDLERTDYKVLNRDALLEKLETLKKRLETKHTVKFIGGGASGDMKDLRGKVNTVIEDIKAGKSAREIRGEFDLMLGYAKCYTDKKKEESIRYKGQKDWKPLTGMGKERFKAAEEIQDLELDDYCQKHTVLKDAKNSLSAVFEASVMREPDAGVEDIKPQLAEVLANMIARPKIFGSTDKLHYDSICKGGPHNGKSYGEALNSEVNKLMNEHEGFKSMMDRIKTANDVQAICEKVVNKDLGFAQKTLVMEMKNALQSKNALIESKNIAPRATAERKTEFVKQKD